MKQLFVSALMTLLLLLNSDANEEIDSSFITKFEYGAMLYNNPRGIGCNKCHGKNGKGMLIASYKQRNKTTNKKEIKSIVVPAISELSLQDFQKKIMTKKNTSLIMPTYFLTQEELSSIHFYISTLDK